MKQQVLIVDGYNMIGAWPELREKAQHSLEDARDRLIELLADYQGYSGLKVIIVFDAHQVPGLGVKYKQHRLDIRYTKAKETADECIERLVALLADRNTTIHVATSDYMEQSVIFGKGALRLSARELLIRVEESQRKINMRITDEKIQKRNTFESTMSDELKDLLEQWRRGGK